jgi:predicted dehydrogenase
MVILHYREPLLAELSSFVNCVIEDREPEIIGEDGLRALQICDATLRSVETRMIVTLE